MNDYSFMPVELPNRTPPSPQAHSITQYGGVDLNESTGMLMKTIPIYSLTAGKLSLPISLTYTGAGVKVNQLPSWVGMNWNLNAGGAITRTVNDLADEMPSPEDRIYATNSQLQTMAVGLANGTTHAEFFNRIATDEERDSEVDIFNFSFAEYSGSFFLNENFEVVQQKKESPLVISIVGEGATNRAKFLANKSFKIVTPDGVTYLFGNQYTETTSVRTIVNGDMTGETTQGVTAFYLYKIVHPVHGEINLSYGTEIGDVLSAQSKDYTETRLDFTYWGGGCGVVFDPDNPLLSSATVITTKVTRVTNSRYLTQISGGGYNILFESDHVGAGRRKLNKIVIETPTSTVRTLDFDYIIDQEETSTDSRHFLERIVFDDNFSGNANTQLGRRNEVYEFYYDSPTGLPDRFSSSQDIFGFANGKNNGILHIPHNNRWGPYQPQSYADRSPNFQYAKRGTLTDIFYPTGGRTHIDYEPTKAKEPITTLIGINAFTNRNEIPSSYPHATWPEVDPEEGVTPFTVPFMQEVIFHIDITAEDANSMINGQHNYVDVIITNITGTPTVMESRRFHLHDVSTIEEPDVFVQISEQITLTLNPGYQYRIDLIASDLPGEDTQIEAHVNFQVVTGYQTVDAYGVRVKRATDFLTSDNNSVADVKRYYYHGVNDINYLDDLSLIGNYPSKISFSLVSYLPTNWNSSTVETIKRFYKTISSSLWEYNSPFERLSSDGQPTVSVSYGGDLFEKGGIEKTFMMGTGFEGAAEIQYSPPSDLISINMYYTNCSQVPEGVTNNYISKPNLPSTSVMKGKVVSERVIVRKENVLYKNSEKNYIYDYNEGASAYNVICHKLYDNVLASTSMPASQIVSSLAINVQKAVAFQPTLDTIHTKTFIDPVPIGAPDESIYRSVSQIEVFEYNSHAGQPTKKTETTSEGSLVQTRYFYPETNTTLPGSPSLQSWQKTAYDSLYARNVISKPIQIESYRGGDLLSRTRTYYLDFDEANTGNFKFFPQSIHHAKGTNDLEERVVFEDYDGWGNLRLVRYANGAKTYYRTNSRGQVTQKIENYTPPTYQPPIPPDYDANNLPPPDTTCEKQNTYPYSLVTDYYYDVFGNLLRIDDPRCRQKTFHYDARHKLIKTTDDEDNIIEEYDYNYKRY